jgi:platelet-activating factor acetylhydrolase IB subunit alpha
VWDVKAEKCVVTLEGHDNWVTDIGFLPGGKYLVSVSDDKTMRVWDLTSARCTRKLNNIHGHFVTTVAVRGKSIVTGSVDQTVKVWGCR